MDENKFTLPLAACPVRLWVRHADGTEQEMFWLSAYLGLEFGEVSKGMVVVKAEISSQGGPQVRSLSTVTRIERLQAERERVRRQVQDAKTVQASGEAGMAWLDAEIERVAAEGITGMESPADA
jgi:hypothetical protein